MGRMNLKLFVCTYFVLEEHTDAGSPMFFSFFGLILCTVVAALIWNRYRWNRRPEKLCLNCGDTGQPLRKRNGEWYCPYCQHGSPVPLDSYSARQFLKNRR